MASALSLNRRESMLLGLHILAIFIIPHLPAEILLLTDNILVRIALVVAVIASAYTNAVLAIATFIVVALLFVERNKVKMRYLQNVMSSQVTETSPAIESIQTPDTAPPQPPFETPVERSVPFMPQADSGDDSFAPVAQSLNEKTPLPTEGSNDGVAKAISQLYTWVNPNLIQQA
jgi:hypothetical protein